MPPISHFVSGTQPSLPEGTSGLPQGSEAPAARGLALAMQALTLGWLRPLVGSANCTPAHSLVEALEAKACTLPGGSCGSCRQPSVPHGVTSVTQELKPEKCPVAAGIYVRF